MIVLDTHALLWWVNGVPGQLATPAQHAIQSEVEGGRILVSAITAWEISMLVSKGRLALTMDVAEWLSHVDDIPSLEFVPIDVAIALHSTQLPGPFHPDPADRLIVATARHLAATLVTRDEKILAYRHVRTIAA